MVRGLLREMSFTIAKEEELSQQFMWQHYLLQGTARETMSSILKQLAINESMRVEIIARILGCLGQPPLKKREICLTEKTDNPEEMLRWDRDLVDEIIASYKKVLALAQNRGGLPPQRILHGASCRAEETPSPDGRPARGARHGGSS